MFLPASRKNKQAFEKFGSGNRLIDLPKLARLKAASDKGLPITSISYVSEENARNVLSYSKMTRSLVPPFVEGMFREAESNKDIPEFDFSREELTEEAYQFLDELEAMWPKPAMSYHFSHLTPQGIKSYQWLDAISPTVDGTKPSTLIDSIDKETLMFYSLEMKDIDKIHRRASIWQKKLLVSVTEVLIKSELESIEKMKKTKQAVVGNDEAIKVKLKQIKVFKQLVGWSDEWSEVVQRKIMPALKGEGSGVLLDFVDGPLFESGQPSRIPSISLVQQHHDSASIEEGFGELFKTVKKVANAASDRDRFLEYLERSKRKKTPAGLLVQPLLLVEVPSTDLDPAFVDAMLIGKDKLIFRFPGNDIEKFAAKQTASVFGPAGDATAKPTVSTFYYNNQVMMDAIRLNYDRSEAIDKLPIEKAEGALEERNLLEFSATEIDDHLERVWKFVECWKGVSSRSYVESNGTATETLYKFADIPKEGP